MDHSPPGSSVHGILQARILEWVAMPSSRGSSRLRNWTHISDVSCIGGKILYQQHHLGSPILCVCVYIYIYTYIHTYIYTCHLINMYQEPLGAGDGQDSFSDIGRSVKSYARTSNTRKHGRFLMMIIIPFHMLSTWVKGFAYVSLI